MQIGFFFDQSRCIGCYTCVAACRSWNMLDQGAPDLIEIVKQEKGEFPAVSVTHLFITCMHCAEPRCIPACPYGLLMKRPEDGIVLVRDPKQCTACQLCVEACPYRGPKMATANQVNIVKCNMCVDRLIERKSPACVANCPTQALDAGSMDQLVAKYGNSREIGGFPDYRQTKPSIVLRARSDK